MSYKESLKVSSASANPDPRNGIPTIEQELDRMSALLSETRELVGRLNANITPILTNPSALEPDENAVESSGSLLQSSLRAKNERLAAVNCWLLLIIDNVNL